MFFPLQGEYVAPEKIENVFMRSKYVAQAFVDGDSLQVKLTHMRIKKAFPSLLNCLSKNFFELF